MGSILVVFNFVIYRETAYGTDYIGEPISPILAFDSLRGGLDPPPVYIYLGFFLINIKYETIYRTLNKQTNNKQTNFFQI